MTLFRVFLVAFLALLAVYTLVIVAHHGVNLFAVFFGDIAAMTWPGQFNLDFFGFLLLSGIWVLWRNDFRPISYPLALAAVTGGMVFLCSYLLYLIARSNGDIAHVILGGHSESLGR